MNIGCILRQMENWLTALSILAVVLAGLTGFLP